MPSSSPGLGAARRAIARPGQPGSGPDATSPGGRGPRAVPPALPLPPRPPGRVSPRGGGPGPSAPAAAAVFRKIRHFQPVTAAPAPAAPAPAAPPRRRPRAANPNPFRTGGSRADPAPRGSLAAPRSCRDPAAPPRLRAQLTPASGGEGTRRAGTPAAEGRPGPTDLAIPGRLAGPARSPARRGESTQRGRACSFPAGGGCQPYSHPLPCPPTAAFPPLALTGRAGALFLPPLAMPLAGAGAPRCRSWRPRRRRPRPRRSRRRVCSKSRAPRHSPAASHNTAPPWQPPAQRPALPGPPRPVVRFRGHARAPPVEEAARPYPSGGVNPVGYLRGISLPANRAGGAGPVRAPSRGPRALPRHVTRLPPLLPPARAAPWWEEEVPKMAAGAVRQDLAQLMNSSGSHKDLAGK